MYGIVCTHVSSMLVCTCHVQKKIVMPPPQLGGLFLGGMIGGVPVGMQMPGQGGMLALPSAQAR